MTALALAFAAGLLSILSPCVLAAGADRAGAAVAGASARRRRSGGGPRGVVHRAWPVAGAGRLWAWHRRRHISVRGGHDHDRAWRDPAGAVLAGAAGGGRQPGFQAGPIAASAARPARDWAGSLRSACCSARCGRPASARPWGRRRCWPRREKICLRSRSPWRCSASAPQLPLILLGLLSRATLLGVRSRLMSAGKFGKAMLGAAFILIGAAIVSGADKRIEATLVDASPQWLTELTTSF